MKRATLFSLALAVGLSGDLIGKSLADDAPLTATRVFDVRDITLVAADYPLSGALVEPTAIGQSFQVPLRGNDSPNPASQGVFQANPPARAPSAPIDTMMVAIEETVDPPSWKFNGGTVGSYSTLNGELLITQTPQNLSKIDAIFTQLRSDRSSTVRVRADWILLQPGQVNELLKNGRDEKSATPEVSRDALDKMAASAVRYTAEVSCFSGQTVNLSSGRAKSLVTEATPIVGGGGAIGYDVKPELVHYGVALQVLPVVSGGSVTMDLLGEVSQTQDEPATQPAASGLANGVDRLNAVVQHFHTTLQAPLNKSVLVEGMTIDPTFAQPQGAQLYLIVEADGG
jgi:hypothetical protein